MNQLNEKILNIINVRINDVIDWLQSCNSLEEKYELTRDTINYIEGLLSMREDGENKEAESDDDHHNRIIDEAISALNKVKMEYPKTIISLESSDHSTWCNLGNAKDIYAGLENEIIIDAE